MSSFGNLSFPFLYKKTLYLHQSTELLHHWKTKIFCQCLEPIFITPLIKMSRVSQDGNLRNNPHHTQFTVKVRITHIWKTQAHALSLYSHRNWNQNKSQLRRGEISFTKRTERDGCMQLCWIGETVNWQFNYYFYTRWLVAVRWCAAQEFVSCMVSFILLDSVWKCLY